MEPDFEVRNLSEYSVEDLDTLFFAVLNTSVDLRDTLKLPEDKKQRLNIWQYRIKDALSQAKKNETIKL